jgi:hypothetical protein
LIRWGWIPNLSGDISLDFPENKVPEAFATECFEYEDDHFRVNKATSNLRGDKTTLEIRYELPRRIYSEAIHFSLTENKSNKDLGSGTANLQSNGLIRIEMLGDDDDVPLRKIIFEVYMSLKMIFHKHTCHQDEDNEGVDSLLRLEDGESDIDAIGNIAKQFAGKVTLYLKRLNGYQEYYGVSECGPYFAADEFYLLYTQARGEFLYGSTFMNIFHKGLGEDYEKYLGIMRSGDEAATILYSGTTEYWKIAIASETRKLTEKIKKNAEASEKTNQEMNRANHSIKNLTYYVLIFTVVAALTTLFTIAKEYRPDVASALDCVLAGSIMIALGALTFYVIWSSASNKNKDE